MAWDSKKINFLYFQKWCKKILLFIEYENIRHTLCEIN
jgi:hypothetical protein